MPNLLLVISGVCIVAYVLRETLEDLQKKMSSHDQNIMAARISRAKPI